MPPVYPEKLRPRVVATVKEFSIVKVVEVEVVLATVLGVLGLLALLLLVHV